MKKMQVLLTKQCKNRTTVKPLIKDTPKEDKPPYVQKDSLEIAIIHSVQKKTSKEDNLSSKRRNFWSQKYNFLQIMKWLVPNVSFIRRFHCTWPATTLSHTPTPPPPHPTADKMDKKAQKVKEKVRRAERMVSAAWSIRRQSDTASHAPLCRNGRRS